MPRAKRRKVKRFEEGAAPIQGPQPLYGEIAWADPRRLFNKGDLSKGAWLGQYNPSQLVTRKGLSVFDKMRNDDQIKACLSFKKQALLSGGWTINTPESMADEEGEWEVSEFIEYAIKNAMYGTFDSNIMEVLTALDYGYSICEKVWAPLEDGPYAGKVAIKSLKGKKPNDFWFTCDIYGNLISMRQQTPDGFNDYPIEKFVIHTNEYEFGNYYGRSDMEAAYRAWWAKDNTYKWLMMLMEKAGIPPIFIFYDPKAVPLEMKNNLKSVLENLQAGTSGIIPTEGGKDSARLETVEMGKNVAEIFIPSIEMFNKDMSRALLMPGLLGMTPSGTTGSYARAQVEFDLFVLAIQKLQREIAKFVVDEQIIKPLVTYNYGPQDEYPFFEFNPITDDTKVEMFDAWQKLAQGKLVTPQTIDEDHIRQSFKFPERQEGTEMDIPEPQPLDPITGLPMPPINGGGKGNMAPGGDDETKPPPQDKSLPPGASPKEKKPAGKPFHVHEFRQKNKYEKSLDFAQIEITLTAMETKALGKMREALKLTLEKLRAQVKAGKFDSGKAINSMRLAYINDYKQAVRTFLEDTYEYGAKSLRQEIKGKTFSEPLYKPNDALAYLREKSIQIASTTDARLLVDVKQTLSNGLKNGWTTQETADRLAGVFDPYTGNESVLVDGEPMEPYRLETIVRTESTAAFNQGRLVMARDPDVARSIQGMEYSAILDAGTTEICRDLDGRIFEMGDPNLDRLAPPNHFNCRSLLVPVMLATQVDSEDFITDEESGKALDRAGDFA